MEKREWMAPRVVLGQASMEKKGFIFILQYVEMELQRGAVNTTQLY